MIKHDRPVVLRRWVNSGEVYGTGQNDEFQFARSEAMVRELVTL